MDLQKQVSITERRKAIEQHLDLDLSHIGNFSLDEKVASKKNCENMIGAIQVPVGIAGKLRITNHELRVTDYYIPLATTEGALVASVNRGCKAITASGGCTVISKKVGITRAPVFVVEHIVAGQEFVTWVEKNFLKIKEITEATSSHLTLLAIKPWAMGKSVFLQFRFDSQDAMGMNMATIAVDKAVKFIETQTTARCVTLSGNMCVDKKPNMLNFIEGRGYTVSADAVIPAKIVESVLKTTVSELCEVFQRKVLYGSIMSGSIGANAHMANVLAAIFLATGQDLGHIAECATGVTTVEKQGDDVYISIYLPDLVVGIVGGGTGLATQKEALSILQVSSAQEFAEVIGGAVLAGELSLLASLAEQSLARAHERLGRGK